jgi:hypothetical protein
VHYFQALPGPEKVITLEDLAPVIELYHHLVKAGKYDEARELFRDRIHYPIYFQLSAYPLTIDLLREMFPEGEDRLPRLKHEATQAWTLNVMVNTYALSGQLTKAFPLFFLQHQLHEKNADKKNLAIDLGNLAQCQMVLGKISADGAHTIKSITLCSEINVRRQGRGPLHGNISTCTPSPGISGEICQNGFPTTTKFCPGLLAPG